MDRIMGPDFEADAQNETTFPTNAVVSPFAGLKGTMDEVGDDGLTTFQRPTGGPNYGDESRES